MKRLFILRHAKSSWAQPGLGDAKRPLNSRGETQVKLLDKWLLKQDHLPQTAVCSPALRTRQTYDGLPLSLDKTRLDIQPSLYNGMIDDYLQIIWSQSDNSVMLIGHNPTCDELSRHLAAPSSPAFEKLMSMHFGTASLAILEFAIDDWSEIREASGQLIQFVRPKELAAL